MQAWQVLLLGSNLRFDKKRVVLFSTGCFKLTKVNFKIEFVLLTLQATTFRYFVETVSTSVIAIDICQLNIDSRSGCNCTKKLYISISYGI